ncbi:MAG: TRAP transporter substrate-binding protein [Gammaproteobacteria bacterium]|nr:TRAP transporter substrate-binding protein [Gammaproteobacteria bacterium]
MKLIQWLSLVLTVIFAPSSLGATELTLAHMFPPASLPDKVAQRFAELVAERSQQSLKITVYNNGYLGDERSNLLSLAKGDIDLAVTGDLLISLFLPDYAIVNMPFLYRNVDHAMNVYHGPIGAAIREKLISDHAIQALSWHYVGTRLLTANQPVDNFAKLHQLALRLPPDQIWNSTWSALGVRTSLIPFTQLFSALERKRVDAQENPPDFIRSSQLYKVQKYLINSQHLPQRQFVLINRHTFTQKLSPPQQQLIEQAAKEASEWLTAIAKKQQQQDIDWLITFGEMQFSEFDNSGIIERLASLPRKLSPLAEQIYLEIMQTK